MKRKDNLFNQITDYNNLRLAYLKALKGKRYTPSAMIFDSNADENLFKLKCELENQKYTIANYRQFKIYDPKERLITATSFEDRIVHHAVMNILEPVFERQFIYHTYACRKNKGIHKAIFYCFTKAKRSKYFLKLDVRKYFDSISHRKLKELLRRIIKDEKCLDLLFKIIGSYEVSDGKGLPIGNLTSQFFANFYLSGLDHFVLEKLKPSGYVRYMDDVIVFSDSKSELKTVLNSMKAYVAILELEFKQPVINACRNGVPFLGYSVSGKRIALLKRNLKRKTRKIRRLEYEFDHGLISEKACSERYDSFQNVIGIQKPLVL